MLHSSGFANTSLHDNSGVKAYGLIDLATNGNQGTTFVVFNGDGIVLTKHSNVQRHLIWLKGTASNNLELRMCIFTLSDQCINWLVVCSIHNYNNNPACSKLPIRSHKFFFWVSSDSDIATWQRETSILGHKNTLDMRQSHFGMQALET